MALLTSMYTQQNAKKKKKIKITIIFKTAVFWIITLCGGRNPDFTAEIIASIFRADGKLTPTCLLLLLTSSSILTPVGNSDILARGFSSVRLSTLGMTYPDP
jgi:hypothetical protein